MNVAYKALSEPVRRSILRLLAEQERTAGEIAAEVGLSPSALTHHLNLLKQAGLIDSYRSGKKIVYLINTTAIQDFLLEILDVLNPDSSDIKHIK